MIAKLLELCGYTPYQAACVAPLVIMLTAGAVIALVADLQIDTSNRKTYKRQEMHRLHHEQAKQMEKFLAENAQYREL